MVAIIARSQVLYRDRPRGVRRLVSPLLPQPPNVTIQQVGPSRDTYTLGVLPRGRNPNSFLNPEDVLVPTRVPNVLMNYYETWQQGARADEYLLDRVYMHIHIIYRMKSLQVLSLHCDPCMKESDAHFWYKRGPHFHVEGATPSVSRAHIALCLMDEYLGGSDLQALMLSFGAAVRLVVAELFPCWDRADRL
jgi:hypothetical protein